MSVTVREVAPDEKGRARWEYMATLGQGIRKGFAFDEEAAHRQGRREEAHLLRVEVHEPGNGLLPPAA